MLRLFEVSRSGQATTLVNGNYLSFSLRISVTFRINPDCTA